MAHTARSLRTPLGKARGLGSAKSGVHHWWMQRLTAAALIPLGLWFVASFAYHAGVDYAGARAWIAHPLVAVLLVLTIIASFYHGAIGMQVVYEDYVHNKWFMITLDVGTKFACFAMAVAAIFSILKIAFGA